MCGKVVERMASVFHIPVSSRAVSLTLLALLALLTAGLLPGCTEDVIQEPVPVETETPEDAGVVYLRFRLNLPGGTRADSHEPNAEGTEAEKAVNRVDLLVYDAGSDKLIDFIRLDAKQKDEIFSEKGLTVPLFAPPSNKARIYVSVNTPDGLADQFTIGRKGHDFLVAPGKSDYWDAINAFVPGSDGKQEKLESSVGIPMTGQFTCEGSEEIDVASLKTQTGTKTLTAEVERIVAKIHVVARGKEFPVTSEKTNIFYVDAKDKTAATAEVADVDYANWIGWIRLSNVCYMPNGMNKSSYLFPQLKDGALTDPNMDLGDYLLGGNLNPDLITRDFIYYSSLNMHRENISPNRHLANADGFNYDGTPTPTYTPSNYSKGMYCLENYFNTPTGDDLTALNVIDYPLPMVTHISIVSRLTPRYIVLLTDYEESMNKFVERSKIEPKRFEELYGFTQEDAERWAEVRERCFHNPDHPLQLYRKAYYIIKALSEADANDILSWSLKARGIWTKNPADFESDKWPDGTFYVYDTEYDKKSGADGSLTDDDKKLWSQRYLYLAPGAVYGKVADGVVNVHTSAIRTYSVPHPSGWGYYYSYINPGTGTDPDSGTTPGTTPGTDPGTDPSTGTTPRNGAGDYKTSIVSRNHYYIVKVDNFGSPGGTITRPEYLRTSTVPVEWDYVAKGDIYLH